MRYGHAAVTRYGSDWNDAAELRMRNESGDLYPSQTWEDVGDTVRLGWGAGRI